MLGLCLVCHVQAVPAEVVKPDNQLQLTETELKEDIAKMLTTAVPDASKAAVRYLYREHAWRPELPMPTDSIMMHHSDDGWLIHKTVDETRRTERARTHAAASAAAAVAASLVASRTAGDVRPLSILASPLGAWCLLCGLPLGMPLAGQSQTRLLPHKLRHC